MSETKFTPGPWAKDKYGQLKNPDGNPVDVWGCGLSIASRSTETEANAALIAAAPDLYAALEELDEVFCTQADTRDERTRARKALIAARAALAKARGES